jgi:outer membrane protein OmpA-like peptidoglycan-associated protein
MSYPWPSDLQHKKQSAAPVVAVPRLRFEPLESRILLSAEIGIPPGDPFMDELLKDRYTTLESRYLNPVHQSEAAVAKVVRQESPPLPPSQGTNPTPDIPIEWVLPSPPLLELDSADVLESQFGGLNRFIHNMDRQLLAEAIDGELIQATERASHDGQAEFIPDLPGKSSALVIATPPPASQPAPDNGSQGDLSARHGQSDFVPDMPDKSPTASDDDASDLTVQLLTLDGSKGGPIIVRALIPPPGADGVILGTVDEDTLENSTFNNDYEGLAGDDVYEFIDGWGDDSVTELAGEGDDTLDFSAVTANLTFTINADGTIDVTDGVNNATVSANVENIIGGQGNDEFIFADGAQLAGTIGGGDGTDTLDFSAYAIGLNIDLVAGTSSGTLGVTDIEDVTGGTGSDAIRVSAGAATIDGGGGGGTDSLVVDAGGLELTSSTGSTLVFENDPATTVTHSDFESVRVDASAVALSSTDLQEISDGLHELADFMSDLDSVAGFDASIPLADPFGITFGDLVNFSLVMQEFVDAFDVDFLTNPPADPTSDDVTAFLADWFNYDLQGTVDPNSEENLSGTITWVANALAASSQVTVDSAGVADLEFTHQFSSTRDSGFDLNLSETLQTENVSVARSTLFDFISGFQLDYSFGLSDVFGATSEFFVDDGLSVAATAGLAGGAVNIVVDTLIGFVDGSLDADLTTLSAVTNIGLSDSGGRWTLTELELLGADPFVINSETGTIDVDLDFDTGAGFDAGVADIADGLIDLASTNFLTTDLVVTLPGESGDFTFIKPNELLHMLDQLGDWLADLSRSEILALNVPFAGNTTIGDLIDFGEAFGEEMLRFLVHHDGLRLSAAVLSDGRLDDANGNILNESVNFSIDVVTAAGPQSYGIVLAAADTSTNTSAADLRDDVEQALIDSVGATLAAEIEVFLEEGRIGFRPIANASTVTGVALPMIGNETLGAIGNNLTVPTSVFETGVLGHALEFTLNVDGEETTISVDRNASAGGIAGLISDINDALIVQYGFDDDGIANISVELDPTVTQELRFELSPNATNISDGTPVGNVILVGVKNPSTLLDGLMSLGVEAASFVSAQDLADQLSAILSGVVGGITVNFDVANSEMSFTVSINEDFVIASAPIDVSVDLGEFIDLESSADLGVTADAALQFTFGVDLNPSSSLVVAPPVSVPALPNLGQLLEDASFDFTLTQDNFLAEERLSGGTLNVGDWTVTAGGAATSVVWTAPISGELFDSDGAAHRDHHFFIEVTDTSGEVTFVDAVLLSFDTDENNDDPLSDPFDELAIDLSTAMTNALASSGFDGLQVSISSAAQGGFQISADGTGFAGYQLRLVTENEFEIAMIDDVTLEASDTDTNNTLRDLLDDLQRTINAATTIAGLEAVDNPVLGLTGVTSIGAIPIVGDIEVPQNGVLDRDVFFEIDIDGTTYKGVVRAAGTIDNEQESENEPDPTEALAADVQAAINTAIAGSGATVTVGKNIGQDFHLEYSITGVTNAELHFFSPAVIAEFTGQRFGVYAAPVLLQPDANNPGRLLARQIVVDAEFDDSAFEQLGLSSSPIPANGVLNSTATFQIIVDDVPYTITVAATPGNSSVGDLIRDINTALETEIGSTDVQVRRVMLSDSVSSNGNRIEFYTDENSGIQSLVLPAVQADPNNAAISQLGFSTDDDQTARVQSGEFFIRDATLSGGLNLDAEDIEASATVGLGGDGGVGIGVEVTDSSGGISGDVILTLVNPNDGSAQISLNELWDYIGSSDLDLTELVDADITGGVAIDLDVSPVLPISTPIDPANIDIDLTLTDWLNNPPSLNDASLGNGLSVNISGLDLNIYDALNNLTFSDVVDALQQVVEFLRELQGDGDGDSGLATVLDDPLPLLNQSPSDLLMVADHFAALVDEVIANPAESLGNLESMLEDLLGVPSELVTLSLDFDDGLALRVDLQFNAGVEESYGFDLALEDLVSLTASDSLARTFLDGVTSLIGVSSTGDLSVGADATVRLSFGIALGTGNGSAEALGFNDGDVSVDGVLTASGDAQAAADRLVDQDIDFELVVDDTTYVVTVTAGDQTSGPVEVGPDTVLSDLKNAPTLVAGDDMSITLRDGTTVDIDLNPLGVDLTILEVIGVINLASDDITAVFDDISDRILIEDSSVAPAGDQQSGVYVTQIGVAEFSEISFSLQVGNNNSPVAVTVAAMSGVTRKEWLATIDEAIRKAMVDAGQLNPVAAAVVDVAYNGIVNGGQLTFQGTGDGFGERLTIYRGGVFGIDDIGSSDVADKLGLKGSDDDGDRAIIGSVLRTDGEADTGGLEADVQLAINNAMGLDDTTQVVDVSLLPSGSGGAGRLQFTTNPALEMEINSISQLLKPFLYNGDAGTILDLHAGASGNNLEFTAQIGPFGFFVIDGSANLDAGFSVTLRDNDGEDDGRTYFDQTEDFEVDTEFGGSAIAELPLFFPTESTPVNDTNNNLVIEIDSLLDFLSGTDESVVIATPDLTAFPTPTLIGMLSNPEFIIDGLDTILLSIQDALDGEIYGIDMPLIGDGLAPAGQFIADFREDVLSYLSLKLREGGLNPVTLVQETLYNIFGSEDDGDPAAVLVLGFDPGAGDTGLLTASTVLTSGLLGMDAEFNLSVGDDDPTRIVVFAEDITEDTPEALVEAINDSLDGRGLAEDVTAGFVTEPDGRFRLTFTATDPTHDILIASAGAIALDLFGLSVGALDFLQDATDDGIVDIDDILKTGFGLFDEFGQFDFLLGQSTVFGQSLDFDLGLPILDFDLDAGIQLELGWELGFGFGVSQNDGFYFVSDSVLAPESIINAGEFGELIISLEASLLGVLGFAPGTGSDIEINPEDGPVVLTATAELPGGGDLSGDVVFALDVGGVTVDNIMLLAGDRGSTSNLVADIEAAINDRLLALGMDESLVTAEMVLDSDNLPTNQLRLVAAAGTTLAIYDSATAMGRLGFLALQAVDGGRAALGQIASEYSGLSLEIVVDILDPGTGSNNDGRLSFSEMSSSSTQLSDIITAEANGSAMVDLGLTVNFDGLGLDASFLPAIGTDLMIDWAVSFGTADGAEIGTPDVMFEDITLDLGSFVTDFAGPFLADIGEFLEPLGFLLDRQDGLLYKRLPVISDLAGETVTLKQLAELLDTENKITPFLNAVEQIYFLTGLVADAATEAENNGGAILIHFGNVSLSGSELDSASDEGGSLADAAPNLDGLISGTQAIDGFNTSSGAQSGGSTAATQSFTRSVTRPSGGAVTFNILQAGTIVDLLLGKPDVTLIEYDLPPFGFDFEYLQRFPIYPPLFATLRGFFSATIDLGFGYDTLGLNQFLASENPLDLVNGFFLQDLDANGVDIPELTLYGGIAAGASLDVLVASAGVEGGIDATIYFNLNDPDQDSKVRLSEMLANILLNYYNPIAVFDTSGKIDAFLRAYVEVLFGLWSAEYEVARVTLATFNIPFARPPVLAQDIGNGVLQLNMGTASANRIHGSLVDNGESLTVRTEGGSVYVSNGSIEQRYIGIEKIMVNSGAGNDRIDLRGVLDSTIEIEIHGGTGNDTIFAAPNSKNVIFGGEGNDRIIGGGGDDEIDGGEGNDTIIVAGGDNIILGGAGSDNITTGIGNDDIEGGDGDDVIDGGDGDDVYRFRGNWGNDQIMEVTGGDGGADTWDFTGTATDISFSLGADAHISAVENVTRTGDQLRITSTRHGLQTGDHITLTDIQILDAGGTAIALPSDATVTVDPNDPDSFTIDITGTAIGDAYVDGTGIFQLDRSALAVDEVRSSDPDNPDTQVQLIQIETDLRHGLEDGDVIRIGGSDPISGETLLDPKEYTVTVVDANTFNLDDTPFVDSPFAFDNIFVQRQEAWQVDSTRAESLANSVTADGFGVEQIIGGRGGDTFDIYVTGSEEVVLDGAGGSDTYRAHALEPRVANGATSNSRVFDTGDFWDTDVALFFGSQSADELEVDNTRIVTVLGDPVSDDPSFDYGEPNIVVGFQSGSSGINTVLAGNVLTTGQLDRDARILLTVGDADPVLLVVEPDDVAKPGTVDDLVKAINFAIANSDLAGLVDAREDMSNGESHVAFDAIRLDPSVDVLLTVENLSQGSGIEVLEIESLGGDDVIQVDGTNSRTSVNVSGGLGDDFITVGGSADGSSDEVLLEGIRGSALTGPLIIDGNEGINSLAVTDADDQDDNTGTLTNESVSGLGMGIDIEYADMSFVSVQLGAGSDSFIVESTIDGTTAVRAGDGNDDVDVETASGIVNVFGEDGDDAVLLMSSNAGSTVTISGGDDADDIDVRAMEGNTFVRGDDGSDIIEVGTTAGLGEPGLLNLVNGQLDISGGTGVDTLIIDDSGDGALTTTAQAPLSTLAESNGRMNGDATFELDFGDGDVVQITVAADIGTLSASGPVDASVQTNGQLSGDAFFVLNVGGNSFDVTVEQDDSNMSLTDLLDDVNEALELAGLDPERVVARLDAAGDTLVLDSLQGEDVRLKREDDSTAATELGFADDSDAVFSNNSMQDLEADIRDALVAAGVDGQVSAAIDPADNTLTLTLISGEYMRVGLDPDDPASADLGLADNQLIQPNNVGTLRINTLGRAELVGLGMGAAGDGGPGIIYDGIAAVNIALGSGHDEFNVQGTLNDEATIQSLTTLTTGDGDDVINVSDTAPNAEADRGQLNGTLDSVQGELSIFAGDGHNTLNVSDREATAGDSDVIITNDRIEGLAAGAINYTATGGFAGGVSIWAGQGSDTVDILSTRSEDVTTFHANDGDDQITVTDADSSADDGLLIIEGGIGDDLVDASLWNNSLFIFGDLGEVDYLDRTRALDQISSVSTLAIELGGSDQVFGGSADDWLLGGTQSDTIAGGMGNDAVIGDGGQVTFIDGNVDQIGATDFFIGDDDILAGGNIGDDANDGGDGHDVIIGGAGLDLLFGTLSEDILIYEYGRVTFMDDLVTSVVVLGQSPLDNAASTMFGLYLKDRFLVEPYHVGDVFADRSPIEASIIDVSTGGRPHGTAYHEEICTNILNEVAFENGSSILTPESYDYLKQTAAILAGLDGVVVNINGHADSVGTAESNQRLSLDRAQSVANALAGYGVQPEMLRAVGHGEEQPIADNETEEGRAENRRVEIETNNGAACDALLQTNNEGGGMIGLLAVTGWRSQRELQQQQQQQINW